MALPILDKTWIFKVNQINISTGSVLGDMRLLHLGIKQLLTSATGWTNSSGSSTTNSYPWTVSGSAGRNGASSDSGAIYANTNDNWQTVYDLVWAAPGVAHSWIVLRQPQINPNFEICMNLGQNTSPYNSHGFVSHQQGFNLSSPVNTAPPTAADMITHYTGASNISGYTGVMSFSIGCMMSTDGQCTRLFMVAGNAPKIFWLFDKPKNIVSGWTNPSIALMTATSGTNPATYSILNDVAYVSGYANSLPMWMYMSTEFYISGAIGENQLYANQITGDWPITPIGLVSDTAGCRGRHGEIYDLYYTSTVLSSGALFTDSENTRLMCYGNLVLPWNSSDFVTGV